MVDIESFKKYLLDEGKSKNTIDNYIRSVRIYVKWVNENLGSDFNKLYRSNILDYRSYLQNQLRLDGKTINNKLSSLAKLNKYLIAHKIQEDTVINKGDLIRIQNEVVSPCKITKDDVEKFRQKILENESKRDFAIITIMAYAGLRISECLQIKYNEINIDSKEIIVRSGKGNKQRVVYLNDKIVNAVKEYLKERKDGSEFLFVSQKRNKLDRTRINHICNKYSDIITPHMLRHFFCTNALEAGYSYHEIANQAGHSDIRTSMIYTNPNKEKMKEKANRL